jgi:hypothetical protein
MFNSPAQARISMNQRMVHDTSTPMLGCTKSTLISETCIFPAKHMFFSYMVEFVFPEHQCAGVAALSREENIIPTLTLQHYLQSQI